MLLLGNHSFTIVLRTFCNSGVYFKNLVKYICTAVEMFSVNGKEVILHIRLSMNIAFTLQFVLNS